MKLILCTSIHVDCFLEVEDVTKEWTWREKFDLIHLSYMVRAPHQWILRLSEASADRWLTHI